MVKQFKNSLEEYLQLKVEEIRMGLKPILTVDEVSRYLDLSPDYIYKMTHNREIPHYKPSGKKLYFKREEIDEWVLRHKVLSIDELNAESRKFRKRK